MSISGLSDWLQTPLGQYVLQWEQTQYDAAVVDIFGFNAVQIGWRECDLLRANRMPLRLRCDAGGRDGRIAVNSAFEHLPFATASIDLVILPHILEFSTSPHQVLREVERVLVPEGQVVITGFNPFSLWGVRRKFLASSRFPWSGRYLSVMRLKDWLTLLNFETREGSFGCYRPPVEPEKWLRNWQWMELAGNRWWPIAGSVYMIQAVKRVHGMRLITPAWRDQQKPAPGLAPATQRTKR